MSKIILASASPRRRELLKQIGLKFEIDPSSKEEVLKGAGPAETVCELAEIKAEDVYSRYKAEDVLVIGADTIVAYEHRILGKPKNEMDSYNMLKIIQGKKHQVYTGVCLRTGVEKECFYVKTDVFMREMTDETIWAYIASGEPADKAGSYGIQGLGAVLIKEIHGDYNNVVGLPISEVYDRILNSPDMARILLDNKE